MQSLQDHFLIAMPAMADPNFNETVTYICKHDADGAFGMVVNRPSDLSLGEMLGQLAIDLEDRSPAERPGDAGGPVEPERGFVLHRSNQAYEATIARGRRHQGHVVARHPSALGRGEGPGTVARRARLCRLGPRPARGRARQQHVAHGACQSGDHFRYAVRATVDGGARSAGRRHSAHHAICRSCLSTQGRPRGAPSDRHILVAFDFGFRRIGIATANLETRTASPLTTLRVDREPPWTDLDRIIDDWRPAHLVVGVPEGEGAAAVARTRAAFAAAFGRALWSAGRNRR